MSRNYFYLDVARVRPDGEVVGYKGKTEFSDIRKARAKLMTLLPKRGKGYLVGNTIYYGPGVARGELGMITRKDKEWIWTQNNGLSYTLWRDGSAKQILDYGKSKEKY